MPDYPIKICGPAVASAEAMLRMNRRRMLTVAISQPMPGGRLHVVDFGNCERSRAMSSALLLRWLAVFEVTPGEELERELSAMADGCARDLKFERAFRGRAQYAVLTLAAGPSRP